MLGAAISCKAKLHPTTTLSTTKTEYIALMETVKETLWLKGL